MRKSGVIFLVMKMKMLNNHKFQITIQTGYSDEDNGITRDTIDVCDEKSYHESDDDLPLAMRLVDSYYGKDGTKWNREKPLQIRRAYAQNVLTEKSGVKETARQAKTIVDSWYIFFPKSMLEIIVKCTNVYIQKVRPNFTRERDASDTNIAEIKAVIEILYMIGAIKCGHRSSEDLWKKDGTGAELFSCVMSERRFRCKTAYFMSEYTCIDEKLQAFRGKCSFRQYIPSKPAKYGIKIFALCDNLNFYTGNLEIYAGTQPDGPFKVDNGAASVVKRLIQPISKTGRNVTTDNWFTSVELANDLQKTHKLSLLGTLRKNKRQIPPEFTQTKHRIITSSYFAFSKNQTLVSYMPKKNKIVLVLSTMHFDKAIDTNTNEARKPEIITLYNATKGAVDNMDRMTENYTVARKSFRWPLTVFYSMLNIGGVVNAQIIYQESCPHNKKTRLDFLKCLSRELMKEHMEYRCTIISLPKEIKNKIVKYGFRVNATEEIQRFRQSGRCSFCDRNKVRKTTKVCTNCARLICRDHLIEMFPSCCKEM
eukprot:XP_008189893.1 PREDICTED: piggyBac transposable element-derived protein 4-like [Acyrthosiphon pisum]